MAKKPNLDLSILPDNRPALKGDECLNCGTPLNADENFCHYCGQRNDRRRLSFWEFISESLRSYFSLDSKVIHSLGPLFFKPGKLTREFIDGKRQQYVHPIRMYLTVSIIYFTLLSLSNLMGRPDLGLINVNNEDDGNVVFDVKFDEGEELDPIITELQTDAGQMALDSLVKQDLSEGNTSNALSPLLDSLAEKSAERAKTASNWWDTIPNPGPYQKPIEYYLTEDQPLARINDFIEDHDSIPVNVGLDFLQLENNRLNRFMYREVQKGRSLEWQDFIKFFASKLPIIAFLFLPLFALSFWAVYFRRNYYYIEHLIFLFHVQTVFFLLLLTKWLVNFSFPDLGLSGFIMLLFAVYAYLAMKRFYNQGYLKTTLKFILVNMGFWVLGIAFGLIAFLITFLVY